MQEKSLNNIGENIMKSIPIKENYMNINPIRLTLNGKSVQESRSGGIIFDIS